MGRSTTSKYVQELFFSQMPWENTLTVTTPMTWDCRRMGRPTLDNLEQSVLAFVDSQKPGECNAHLSESKGYVLMPTRALIRENRRGGRILVEWKAGAFQVYPKPRRKVG